MGAHRLSAPVDPGLQQERTALAWERTGLSLTAAAVGVGRHALGHLGWAVLVPCALVAVCGLWVWLDAQRRGRQAAASTREPAFDSLLRDGRLPALVAALVAVLCLAEAAGSIADALA